jgi:hypothetical protein
MATPRIKDDVDLSKLEGEERAKARRARQTLYNLLYSLAACIGLVVILVIAVPRPTQSLLKPVAYEQVAASAHESSGEPIVAPTMPGEGWYSNSARWNGKPVDGVANWYVGFVGPKNQYLGLTQAFVSNQTWLVLQLKGNIPTGTTTIDGRRWTVWQSGTKHDPVLTKDYAMVTEVPSAVHNAVGTNGNTGVSQATDQVIIYGTASKAEFKEFALLVSKAIDKEYQK